MYELYHNLILTFDKSNKIRKCGIFDMELDIYQDYNDYFLNQNLEKHLSNPAITEIELRRKK